MIKIQEAKVAVKRRKKSDVSVISILLFEELEKLKI